MNRNTSSPIARLIEALRPYRATLMALIHERIEARRQRIEQDKEFYRKLANYCRTNNLSPLCEDDWKTAAYSKDR